ncbi:paraquat-inducible protein A [Pseudoalteromonas sp. SSDWG2]|uniref:paraquat-inducible protein A n=1 Tax=Pseudoalteromonas sp. SSDWG2 TaxID=3139391 RepID=UPI003BABC75D
MSKVLIFLLLLTSLVLLGFAVTQPALTIEAKIAKSELANTAVQAITEDTHSQSRQLLYMLSEMLGLDKLEGHIDAYGKTRSIWGTVIELYEHDNRLVAILVGAFSVIVPVSKSLMQFTYLLLPHTHVGKQLSKSAGVLSKWSMADVFVLALIITFLGGNADGHFGQLVIMNAHLHQGFWLFLAYCMLSIVIAMLVQSINPQDEHSLTQK